MGNFDADDFGGLAVLAVMLLLGGVGLSLLTGGWGHWLPLLLGMYTAWMVIMALDK